MTQNKTLSKRNEVRPAYGSCDGSYDSYSEKQTCCESFLNCLARFWQWLCSVCCWLCRLRCWPCADPELSSSEDPISTIEQGRDVEVQVEKTKVKVEVIDGVCRARNGDPRMSEKCNAAFQELSPFQRDFLCNVPPGKSVRLLFTELVLRKADGTYETQKSFSPA